MSRSTEIMFVASVTSMWSSSPYESDPIIDLHVGASPGGCRRRRDVATRMIGGLNDATRTCRLPEIFGLDVAAHLDRRCGYYLSPRSRSGRQLPEPVSTGSRPYKGQSFCVRLLPSAPVRT
jgi:hypothetical protein